MSVFLDTNILLQQYNNLENIGEMIYISSISLLELENIKTSRNKDESTKFAARKASKAVEKCSHLKVEICSSSIVSTIEGFGLEDTPDNRIIATAFNLHDPGLIFITNDLCCGLIAKDIFHLNVQKYEPEHSIYKGYKILKGNTDYINEQISLLSMNTNEYLIINNTDDGSVKEMRFDGEKFVSLKLPPSKFIKGKNSLQRCALDILNNPDITIAAILGGYGSGKSYLTSRMGLYAINEKGWQAKILGVREIVGEGKEIGFLPGEKDSKIGDFFLPLAQQLDGGEFELESLKLRGALEVNTPYFMKGTTYNDTVMLVDEAEDLTEKQIKLIGTRIGTDSRIFLNGDYKQSVVNNTESNALVKMVNNLKGNPMFATIYLGEDVRSTTSKLFANMFED